MEVWLCHLHINCPGIFFPSLQNTKSKMEKSLYMLAAVIFLGGLLDGAGALISSETTARSFSLFNNTTATLKWTESVTVKTTAEPQDHSSSRWTPTTPQTTETTPTTAKQKLPTTTVRGKQLERENISQDSEEIKNKEGEDDSDDKTENGKKELGKKILIRF